MEKEESNLKSQTLIHFPLSEAEVLPRSYGIMYRLSATYAGLKNMQVLLMEINPGYSTSRHHHPNEEVLYVMEGEVVVHGEDSCFTIKVQDTLIIRPGEVHQLENKSHDQICRIMLAVSPPRDQKQVVY